MGVGAGLYMYDVVVKNSRSLSHPISWWVCLLLSLSISNISRALFAWDVGPMGSKSKALI